MRLHLPRFTVRRMMVAVAIVALVLSVGIFSARSRSFAILAREYASMETKAIAFDKEAIAFEKEHMILFNVVKYIRTDRGTFKIKRQNVAYYAQIKEKYEWLARYPWLPVEPDPPEPE
jgi:hypothetical protein